MNGLRSKASNIEPRHAESQERRVPSVHVIARILYDVGCRADTRAPAFGLDLKLPRRRNRDAEPVAIKLTGPAKTFKLGIIDWVHGAAG